MLEGTSDRGREKKRSLLAGVISRIWWIGLCRLGARSVVLAGWAMVGSVSGSSRPDEPRKLIDLNGPWQVEQGDLENVPGTFAHEVAVPGLVDMAQPPFRNVGKVSPERQAFWYRRIFKVEGHVPEVARLKVHKARYGLRAILNGHDLGTHLPCFTAAYFDVRSFLKGDGQENVLVVRVGANPGCLPPDMPRGWDFEKYLYIPGLYDTVELLLTGTPFIKNVQIVPDLVKGAAHAVVEVEAGRDAAAATVKATVREARSGRSAGDSGPTSHVLSLAARQSATVDLECKLSDVKPWSPEDPFLYEMTISDRQRRGQGAVRHAILRFDPSTWTGHAQRQALLHAGNQRLHLPVLRGRPAWRSALAGRLGTAAAPAIQDDALELDSLLHRLPARLLV